MSDAAVMCVWYCDSSWLPACRLWRSPTLCMFQISSSICLLRGKIYDAMDNRLLATSSYKEALKLDVYCFEAFDLLTSHHMLTAQEGEERHVLFFFSSIFAWTSNVSCSIFKDSSVSTTKYLFVFPNRKRLPRLASFKSTMHSGRGAAVTFPLWE